LTKENKTDKLFLCNGKAYSEVSTSLYEGSIPVALPEKKAVLSWKGSLIPWKLYCEIVAFFRWTYEDSKSESQCRLAYNEKTREWKAIVLPQKKGTGMTTSEIENHPDKAKMVQDMYKAGFEFAGTFHHHCSAAAFQSGTDTNNEITQTGLHVTVGKIDEPVVDLHSRLVFRGVQYEADLADWIGLPEHLAKVVPLFPAVIRNGINKYYTTHPEKSAFPETWKSSMVEEPETYAGYGAYSGVGRAYEENGYYASGYPGRRYKTFAEHRFAHLINNLDRAELSIPTQLAFEDLLDVMDQHNLDIENLQEAADYFQEMENALLTEQTGMEKEEVTGAKAAGK